MKKPAAAKAARPSIVFTAIVLVGLAIAIAGAVVAIVGVGAPTAFSVKVGELELRTTNCGIALLGLGSLLAGLVATRLPKGVTVFEPMPPTPMERVAEKAPQLMALGLCCLLLAVFAGVERGG